MHCPEIGETQNKTEAPKLWLELRVDRIGVTDYRRTRFVIYCVCIAFIKWKTEERIEDRSGPAAEREGVRRRCSPRCIVARTATKLLIVHYKYWKEDASYHITTVQVGLARLKLANKGGWRTTPRQRDYQTDGYMKFFALAGVQKDWNRRFCRFKMEYIDRRRAIERPFYSEAVSKRDWKWKNFTEIYNENCSLIFLLTSSWSSSFLLVIGVFSRGDDDPFAYCRSIYYSLSLTLIKR